MEDEHTYLDLGDYGALEYGFFTFGVTVVKSSPNLAIMTVMQSTPPGEYTAKCYTYQPSFHAMEPAGAREYVRNLSQSTWLSYESVTDGVHGGIHLTTELVEHKKGGIKDIRPRLTLHITVDNALRTGDMAHLILQGPPLALWAWRTNIDAKSWQRMCVPIPTSAEITLPPGDVTFRTKVPEIETPQLPAQEVLPEPAPVPVTPPRRATIPPSIGCDDLRATHYDIITKDRNAIYRGHGQRVSHGGALYVSLPIGFSLSAIEYEELSQGLHVFVVRHTKSGKNTFAIFDIIEVLVDGLWTYVQGPEPVYVLTHISTMAYCGWCDYGNYGPYVWEQYP